MTSRIIFFCGRGLEPWVPPKLDETGIGGSETAVVKVAERFARAGWRVDVYNDAGPYEGEYGDVGYWDCSRLRTGERCDVLVSWRNPAAHELPVEARARLLWLHDLNQGPGAGEHFARFDRVLGVSAWHAGMLRRYYPGAGVVEHVPNGIDLDRFDGATRKVPWRCVYASSPDRGLQRLLHVWPTILTAEPEAELHVCYGWQNIDTLIQQGRGDLAGFKAEVEQQLARTPRVVWRGRLGQKELAQVFGESVVWTYPTSFLETSCITAMEAMAGGCVPVVPPAGALKETVGDGGLIVPGLAYGEHWKEAFAHAVKGVLLDGGAQLALAERARERARAFTWDASFERWRRILAEVLGSGEEFAEAAG